MPSKEYVALCQLRLGLQKLLREVEAAMGESAADADPMHAESESETPTAAHNSKV